MNIQRFCLQVQSAAAADCVKAGRNLYLYIRFGPRDGCESVDLTDCVTRGWAGVDSVREQKKLEARKCLKTRQNPQRPVHAVLGSFYHQLSFPFANVSLVIIVSLLRSFEW